MFNTVNTKTNLNNYAFDQEKNYLDTATGNSIYSFDFNKEMRSHNGAVARVNKTKQRLDELDEKQQQYYDAVGNNLIGTLLAIPYMPASIYMHESGHDFAISQLFKNATSEITLSNYGFAGLCKYFFEEPLVLTELGEKIGKNNARVLFYAAGPLTDIITALAATCLSQGNALVSSILFPSSFNTSYYALSGLWQDTANCGSHDFCQILRDSGPTAYGALTAACLATTVLVAYNAFNPLYSTFKNLKNSYSEPPSF